MNPTLGRYLLEGLFQYQETGQYPNKWSVHDLGKLQNLTEVKKRLIPINVGASYPKALGHNDGELILMSIWEARAHKHYRRQETMNRCRLKVRLQIPEVYELPF